MAEIPERDKLVDAQALIVTNPDIRRCLLRDGVNSGTLMAELSTRRGMLGKRLNPQFADYKEKLAMGQAMRDVMVHLRDHGESPVLEDLISRARSEEAKQQVVAAGESARPV